MSQIVETRSRKEWVDALRALAMFLVVYGHQVGKFTEYFVFTSPIKITLFFAITGYVFNQKSDVKTFFYKLFRQIIVPWLVLSLLPYIILTPFKGTGYLLKHINDIIVGRENWYMPCCIIAEIIWFFILKYGKRPAIIGGVSIVCFWIGIVLHNNGILDIFMVNRALCVLVYMFFGYLFKCYEKQIDQLKNNIIVPILIVVFCLIGLLSLVIYPGQNLDVHLNRYYNLSICMAMIALGLYIVFVAAKKTSKYPKIILLIGRNTLAIYLLHAFAVPIIVKVFELVNIPINLLTNIVVASIAIMTCLIISLIMNYFCPEVLGKA